MYIMTVDMLSGVAARQFSAKLRRTSAHKVSDWLCDRMASLLCHEDTKVDFASMELGSEILVL